MAGSTSMELTVVEKEKGSFSSLSIREQWEVEYSRFFHFPDSSSFSSIHPSLTPLQSPAMNRFRGSWISTSSASFSTDCLVSLRLVAGGADRRSVVLLIALRHKVLEEHYISKLHFTWPQVSCLSGYPARGSRVVFLSYKDSAGQIQKFALRFLTVYDSEQFINSLKEILENSNDAGESCRSVQSPQSECIISSGSPYRPAKDWTPVPSANTSYHKMTPILNSTPVPSATTSYHKMTPILNHEAVQESNTLENEHNHQVGITPSAFPPSFRSLLMNYCPAAEPVVAQPPVCQDAELKDQIARYMEDISFQDMLSRVERVISEIGGDLIL